MEMQFNALCPICNALILYGSSQDVVCPHCSTRLLVGNSDPTNHSLSEIDPDAGGAAMGVFHLNLHPVGTSVCIACQHIYPNTFECCPYLVDLALISYQNKTREHGPKTDSRIADFLRNNVRVVTNTVRLRAIESKLGKVDKKTFKKFTSTLKTLGMLALLADEA